MSDGRTTVSFGGMGMGGVLAMILSYTVNHHIGWAILHGFFSWFYVIYHAIKY